MAEQKQERTLEMRIAELEDKLSKISLSEEEIQTLQQMYGGGMQAQAPAAVCVISQCVRCIVSQCIRPCIVSQCIRPCIIQQCIISQCIWNCIVECSCGPCAAGGQGGGLAGGFGGLGM